jgi:molybdopterin-guanine dinucleotide biosynthesis protein A
VRLSADRDDVEGIAQWILSWLQRRRALREGLVGVVLTGGASRRMGMPKCDMTIAGRRVMGRLCDLLADRISQVMIVGRQPRRDGVPLCAAWHPDIRPGLGPLTGIATGLRVAAAGGGAGGVCVVGCDMPLLGGEVLDYLLAGRNRAAPSTIAVNPQSGLAEPLLAVYEAAALETIEAALDCGRLSVMDCLAGAGAQMRRIPEALAGQLQGANTPEELEAIWRRLEAGEG